MSSPRPRRDHVVVAVCCHACLSAVLLSGVACVRPSADRDQGPFTVVMLPDTQIYSKHHPDTFYAQTRWIRANRDCHNIRFVTQVGDIVNDLKKDPRQWDVASGAMAVLDGVVPYGVAIGNHDFDGSEDGLLATEWIRHFGPERYPGYSWYGGASENKLNSCQLFSGGGIDFVVLHLEIAAPDSAIVWASKVLNKYSNRAAIVSTHAYLYGREGIGRNTKPIYNRHGNSAEELWEKFIRRHPQVFMVLCGHEKRTEEFHQVSTNDAGGKVLEIMADYQKRPDGGQAFLRLFRFIPDDREIMVRTYSPALERFETDDSSQFTLPWELPETQSDPAAQTLF